jgi:3D (Asp-Asp-Asp) domain-containing protein
MLWYGPATVSGRRTRSAVRLAGFSAVIVLIGVSAAAAARPGIQNRISSLRGQSSVLAGRTHHAMLDLYALDTRLANARARLSSLQAQAAKLRQEQALLAQQVSVTRRNLADSQRMLAANLRTLYEQGQTDPLAVVLGAASLEDAVTKLDDLSHVAEQSKRVVNATTVASKRLARLRLALAGQRIQIEGALASARRTANELAAAHVARIAFISGLRHEQRLKAAQIDALEAGARRAEKKSEALQSSAVANTVTPQTPADPAPANAAPGARTLTVSSTGYSLPGHTATGLPVSWGVVAVDPSVIPLGTRMTIPGYGEGIAADVGSAVRGADIDLWFPTLAQARAWGRRTVTITLH